MDKREGTKLEKKSKRNFGGAIVRAISVTGQVEGVIVSTKRWTKGDVKWEETEQDWAVGDYKGQWDIKGQAGR